MRNNMSTVENVVEAAKTIQQAIHGIQLAGNIKIGYNVMFTLVDKNKKQLALVIVSPIEDKEEATIEFA